MKRLTLLLIPFITLTQVTFTQKLTTEKYCKNIKIEVDKFTGETRYRTPLLKQIHFIKYIKNGEEKTYMMISTIGSTPATGKGVILLLENGEKITKNIETNVSVNTNAQFEHTAFFSLNKNDIELLKKYNVTDTRLYIFDMEIIKPIQYRAYIICLENKH